MDLHNFLRTRRSIRRFKPDPIPDSVIKNILTTATFAPSAHNRQPWRFCVLTDLSVKQKLADAMGIKFKHDLEQDQLPQPEIQKRITRSRERIIAAPVVIILSVDMSDMDVYPDEKRNTAEYLMAVQSVANAGMQMLLAAHAEGLGGNWICWALYAQEETRAALNLSENWEPQAFYFLGYPDETPELKNRKPIKELATFNV